MANSVDVKTAYELQQSGIPIYDVREPEEFNSGHAQDAISIPLTELGERYTEIPQDQEVLIICKSGGRSGQACDALEQAGYKVTNVAGGSLDWFGEKLPFVSESEEEPTVI